MPKTRPLLLVLAVACALAAPQPASAHNTVHRKFPHALKPAANAAKPPKGKKGAPPPAPTPTGPHLNYYGGRVISNVKIVPVFWTANIDPEVKSQIGTFYSDFTGSPAFDWLSEYDTTIKSVSGKAGTGQHIGRGTAVAPVVITPKQAGSNINDAQIQKELAAQIKAKKLPAPDLNTMYMMHFPKGFVIKSGSGLSCQAFCAYHGTMNKTVYYGVIPDGSVGSGCDKGCGSGTPLGNLTASAAHEITEAVTDAQVGAAGSGIGPPIAWYDPNKDASGQQYAEIGDICAAYEAPLAVNGRTWTIQKEWSNKHNGCIALATDTPVTVAATSGAGSGSKRLGEGEVAVAKTKAPAKKKKKN